jgi:hypothetical protein
MIVCVDISQRTKDQLDRLLDIGEYRDYSEAVAVAISNQLLFQQNSSAKSAAAIQPEIPAPRAKTAELETENEPNRTIPRLFAHFSADPQQVKLVSFEEPRPGPNGEFSIDQWIFGQHNKLLPVKATCRALANLLLKDAGWHAGIPITKAASEIASAAVKLGDYLRTVDSALDVNRDEAFAFAFPYSDSPNGDKARLRYANQFVANLSKQGVLTGLPVELKFVHSAAPQTSKLLLTEPGFVFAQMPSPVLDGDAKRPPTRKFSDEESTFLLNHICTRVPEEAFAYTAVAKAITAGANTPEKLDASLARYLPDRPDKPFTAAFLTTQRAGAVSRMIDLGLLQRVRDGVNVSYTLTNKGFEFTTNPLRQAI